MLHNKFVSAMLREGSRYRHAKFEDPCVVAKIYDYGKFSIPVAAYWTEGLFVNTWHLRESDLEHLRNVLSDKIVENRIEVYWDPYMNMKHGFVGFCLARKAERDLLRRRELRAKWKAEDEKSNAGGNSCNAGNSGNFGK